MASVIRRVRTGETVELTDHGFPVARIVPIHHRSQYDQMVAEGRLVPGEGSLADCEPLPAPPGSPTASEILAELRSDER